MLTKLEVRRQSAHILCGIILLSLIQFDYGIIIPYLAMGVGMISLISTKYKLPGLDHIFRFFERKTEHKGTRIKGLVFYLIGVALTFIYFEKSIALAATAILAFGDSISRLAGPFGYVKHPFHNEKFMDGIVLGWVAATLVAWLFVPIENALIAAGVAMFLEGIDFNIKGYKVDDNLLIPLISALVLKLIIFVY